MNQQAFLDFTYGLFVLGADKSACIINTAGQATTSPAQITFCVNSTGYTCARIKETRQFTLSILDEEAPFDLFRHFGFQSGKDVDKWSGWQDKKTAENGLYYNTQGANAFMAGTVEQAIDLGSHTLFIAKVEQAEVLSEVRSVTYTYYHENIKPQWKKEEPKEGRTAWRCKICGYIYDHPDLPADYICPLCKHPASDFEKITI